MTFGGPALFNAEHSHFASRLSMSSSSHRLPFASVDLDRESRQGFPEVIYGEGKTPEQVAAIGKVIYESSGRLLVTRASEGHFAAVRSVVDSSTYERLGRCVYALPEAKRSASSHARIAIISAGTSDLPVAMEAHTTLRVGGVIEPQLITDVGVAGIHRLLERSDDFRAAQVVIVIAGMEGALPSVVGGLVHVPVIAVPTSVGYGTSYQGIAALLGMLNSCASGLSVVNIDNGFGAAMAAMRILNVLNASTQS